MSEPRIDTIDVAVVGGGPAGAAAAIALRARGRSVVVVDRLRDVPAIGETLPPDATPLLRELGVWDAIRSGPHQPAVCNQSAWGASDLRTMSFVANPYGHGWHLDRGAFDAMLRDAARDAGADVRSGHVRHVAGGDRGWRLDVAPADGRGGRALHARWIVDASGRSGAVASRLGMARAHLDQLTASALVFTRRTASPVDPDRATLVETARCGWWYTAGLPGGRRIAVCFATPADAPRTVDQWMSAMSETRHVQARLADYDATGSPWLFATGTSRLERPTGHRWLAAGDAAVAYDPVSSYGLMSAMGTGLRAAAAIDAALAGHMAGVTAYEMQLASDFARYQATLDEVYAMERRWPDSAFWAQHLAPSAAARRAGPSGPARLRL